MNEKSKNHRGERKMKVVFVLTFILILATLAMAQTEKNQTVAMSKIAVIDSSVFDSREQGIRRYRELLYVAIGEPGFEKSSIKEKIEALEKEIYCLKSQNKAFDEKTVELKDLKNELKRIEETEKANYYKRYNLIVVPIVEKIREKMKVFANQKGYEIIIDKNSLIESFSPVGDKIDDVTSEFIKFCNDSFDKEKAQ